MPKEPLNKNCANLIQFYNKNNFSHQNELISHNFLSELFLIIIGILKIFFTFGH